MDAMLSEITTSGERMLNLAQKLFPICRSITGRGLRESLSIINEVVPTLKRESIPTGTKCFDWVIPKEWNVSDAYIAGPDGNKFADFKVNNLHLVGYSTPVNIRLSLQELLPQLYSLEDQPDAIPYVTSYYKEQWGFCITDRERKSLKDGQYHAVIKSDLSDGNLDYGEVVIPGRTSKEVFLSTYLCHPSMANNELSGPVVTAELLNWLSSLAVRKFTYRAVFVPETIGSIAYLSRNLDFLKRNVVAGFNITCIGDERCYSYLPSRKGNTISDRVALHVLKHHAVDFKKYTFLDRGSDERQYCSPGVDLPIASLMRSKYGEYPEYHTSLDDFSVVTARGLQGGFDALKLCISALEANTTPRARFNCEPQLGKRGLYNNTSIKSGIKDMKKSDLILNVLAYSDGEHDLLAIAEILGLPIWCVADLIEELHAKNLVSLDNS